MTYIKYMNKGEIKMNGFDVGSALEVAGKFASLARRATTYGYSKERIIEELAYLAENYVQVAERIEAQMEKEAA